MGPRRTLRKEEKLREEDPSVEPEEVVIDFRDDQQSRDLEENDDMLNKIEDDESDAEVRTNRPIAKFHKKTKGFPDRGRRD
jgi:hypothetical protein